ncbi:MAG: fused signal transduction protein/response regulator [Sulfurimonas sp. RIFCSPLOWO2_12_FULL_36_74]|uniref:chemotaxis protein n=1 Tax=Sulfurimonas sp. RIFCSPLOWO2_12_36_12 TaxID=1802253 RepID=UPI0008D6B301|nr:chemotaxis protein [Sulfurimonas sp. RIFCSPLOWO2_12_36_12]OHD97563.1 MAG: fused signal transduction protein/response regulator [Sulfurimonas sp. RIFCSPLOWO2_02_FULL_36_28]OHE00446.1 MAG: fused signal transduction protein/response regulator [Sulfurimonas sp. RIFCSPLOWO2_12_36_12]OHE01334.1 MAG: fused signal transduction protein/response regulator [Sulfurimonas sp. RIFCSPLOWO2_12_FULL_36_74]
MNIESSLKVGSNEMELVDFRIFKQEENEVYEGIYGINVSKVREIIKLPKLTDLPGTPEFIEGIFDLRSVVIPVVNLAKWMKIKEPESAEKNSRVIITEFNNVLIGFIVHEAKRIRRISWADIEPASFMSNSSSVEGSKITGVTKIEGDNVLLILDLESVIQDLGLYEPDTQFTTSENENFSGLALVLDDSSTARKIVKEALVKMGFDVLEAMDGKEGLEKLDELYELYGEDLSKNLKIIISDVEMPRMDGFHFAANVKEDGRFSKIPIVFNSSISDHFSENRGVEAGGEAYLVKFKASSFYNEVARIVRAHMK